MKWEKESQNNHTKNKQQTKNLDLYHIIPEKQCATDHRPKCKSKYFKGPV